MRRGNKLFASPHCYEKKKVMKFEDIKWPKRIFVGGIGTDVGKSYATGWLAREMAAVGHSVITQKLVQTGCVDESDDIRTHRKIMNIPMLTVDHTKITSPLIYKYPASPHLAADMEGEEVKIELIDEATRILEKQYHHVLIEGAGGLMVPLKHDYLTIEYVKERKLPVILVTNGELGSISDTLLSLYALAHSRIKIFGVVYNPHFDKDRKIAEETKRYLREWVLHHYPDTLWMEMPDSL